MSDIETTTVSEEGFVTTSEVDGLKMTVDATGEEGPTANRVLVADYASCFLPAFRVGAQQRGYEDLGRVEIEATADLDDDDDLERISFTVHVEGDIDDEDVADVVERAEDICHVHAALREGLRATIEVRSGAF